MSKQNAEQALEDLDSLRRDYDRMETALRQIVEHGKQQPVPMDPIAFNMMAMARAALDGLEGDEV